MTGLNLDCTPVVRGLTREAARRKSAILEAGRALAARMEASAREDAVWRDRTGRARASIRGRAETDGPCVRMTLIGGAPYSAALEVGYGGRYAVLGPTVRRFAPELLRTLSEGGGA